MLQLLRSQLDRCTVAKRTWTGVGFWTDLLVDRSAVEPIERRTRFHLGDVVAEIPGLQRGAGFVLFVEDGYLQDLEGYSFGEPWPEHVPSFALRYWREPRLELLD